MKLNGGITAVLLGVTLTSTIGWGSYITRRLSDQAVQVAVANAKLQEIERRLEDIGRRLATNHDPR